MLQLGSEDVTQPGCFNGYSPSTVVGLPIPSAGTLQNLTVASNANGAYPITVSVYVNGVITTLGCTITANICADNLDTVNVLAGQTVAVQLSTASATAGSLSIHASLEKQ
jgi:hypothetical protein